MWVGGLLECEGTLRCMFQLPEDNGAVITIRHTAWVSVFSKPTSKVLGSALIHVLIDELTLRHI